MKKSIILILLGLLINLYIAQTKTEENGYIVITFDDLPFVTYTSNYDDQLLMLTDSLLNKIRQFNIPAIGFSNESKLYDSNGLIEKRVTALKKWIHSGLELGNHTFSHKSLNKISLEEFKEEVIKGEPVLKKITSENGLKLRYFRYPFLQMGLSVGKKDSAISILHNLGYEVAPVTIDNSDYIFAKAYFNAIKNSDDSLKKKIVETYIPYMLSCIEYYKDQSIKLLGYEVKQILLLHANRLNAETFEMLAKGISNKGYKFISMEEALKDKAYLSEDRFIKSGGISSIHRWAVTAGKTKEFFNGEPEVPEFILKAADLKSN